MLDKMLILKYLTFLIILLCVAKNRCEFTDSHKKPINLKQYCENKVCIPKCCDFGEIITSDDTCQNGIDYDELFKKLNYTYIESTFPPWYETVPAKSRPFVANVEFIYNKILNNNTGYVYNPNDTYYYITEDGTLNIFPESIDYEWHDLKIDKYCMEYTYFGGELKLTVKEAYDEEDDAELKTNFMAAVLLVSCFFLLLVLVVYSLLPDLRNTKGLMLMAFCATLFASYFLRAIIAFIIEQLDESGCKSITPFFYFFCLASFFWLNVMAYDIWRKISSIYVRGRLPNGRDVEYRKLVKYCLYAWGSALLMTTLATIVDNIDIPRHLHIVKPPFDSCLADDDAMLYYLSIPIFILSCVNIIFFVITIYRIQIVKRDVQRNKNSAVSKRETNSGIIYLKISVMMGVSWVLELIETPKSFSLYALLYSYNLLLGLIIFLSFVANTKILLMLCTKYGIENRYVERMRASRSVIGRSTKLSTLKREPSRSQTQEQQNEPFVRENPA